jgi:hypothetical protein
MGPVNYYEIPTSEPAEKKLTVPRSFILAIYHWLRHRRHRNLPRNNKGVA